MGMLQNDRRSLGPHSAVVHPTEWVLVSSVSAHPSPDQSLPMVGWGLSSECGDHGHVFGGLFGNEWIERARKGRWARGLSLTGRLVGFF